MKLKLDENLGRHTAEVLRAAGHDVSTVPEEALTGTVNLRRALADSADERPASS